MTSTGSSEAPVSDETLVARWKAGDERAATALVERHIEAVTRFVARLGVERDREEVVQDTFVRAFGALEGFRADSSLRTWLFTIAKRLVIDRQRAAGRRGTDVPLDESLWTSGFDALDAMVADEQGERIREALGRLSRMQRAVFLSRVQDGFSYREIADQLGTSEGAARVHYHNAVKAVKEFLDG